MNDLRELIIFLISYSLDSIQFQFFKQLPILEQLDKISKTKSTFILILSNSINKIFQTKFRILRNSNPTFLIILLCYLNNITFKIKKLQNQHCFSNFTLFTIAALYQQLHSRLASQLKINMKVQLSKDPLFQVKDSSPIKQIKSKQIERQRSQRLQKISGFTKKKQLNLQIIDPLPNQLKQYRTETTYRKSVQTSKASQSLKKYIIQQQQNLRCLRLQRFQDDQNSPPKKKVLNISLSPVNKDQQKQNKQINIPRIQDLFKNQSKQYLLYQNRILYNRLGKAINSMNHSITKLKSYSLFEGDNAKNLLRTSSNLEDQEIDMKIQKNMERSRQLQEKIYKEKKQKLSHTVDSQSKKSNDMSYFLRPVQKAKKKVLLQGVRSYTFKNGNNKLSITPATGLLFQLHYLADNRQKKQYELAGLLKNSYQNRDSILSQKSIFYDQETTFADLSPSNQFKLRQLMNKKLQHRLELSKEQVNKFVEYLGQIKDYHVILNDAILQILKQVRKTLLSGKVMKMEDLNLIIQKYNQNELNFYPNNKIVSKLKDMMI